MTLQAGKTYVAFVPAGVGKRVYTHVRTPPAPLWSFRRAYPVNEARRLVFSLWPDAIQVNDVSRLADDVSYLPQSTRSMKGVL